MKAMKDYTIYCTEKQTEKAYKLGAPIYEYFEENTHYPQFELPTTQQMIGWLLEKHIFIELKLDNDNVVYTVKKMPNVGMDFISARICNSYKDAELAAIDAALDYLEKGE